MAMVHSHAVATKRKHKSEAVYFSTLLLRICAADPHICVPETLCTKTVLRPATQAGIPTVTENDRKKQFLDLGGDSEGWLSPLHLFPYP